MTDSRQTYQIAADQIAEYVQPLWQGALAMPIDTRDEAGRRLSIDDDHLSGRYLLLAFVDGTEASDETTEAVLSSIAVKADAIERAGATVLAISGSSDAGRNRALKIRTGFPWPIAGDSTGAVFAAYGLHKGSEPAARLVVITPYRQVRAYFDAPFNANTLLETIMTTIDDGQPSATTTAWGPPHAPVLLVPNVLSAEECGRLIDSFETNAPFMIRPPRPGELAGDYRIPVYEHDRQDRVDRIIKDKQSLAFLDERLWGRVVPMIRKAFAFEVTRREDLHIARYVGERGGHTMGHRDNTGPTTAYRRFALSMSLNDDYEGGELMFREYSDRGYRPPPGTALIFSSSLLHEVLETTSGVRYNLISHLFNEQSLEAHRK